MKVKYRKRALRDLRQIFVYLHERSPTGADHVLSSIDAAIDAIVLQPRASSLTQRVGIRQKILRKYPYKIFYRVLDDAIEIVHIRHAARRPWP